MATDSGGVLFIEWNDDNGRIDGTVQVVTVGGSPPNASTTSDTVSVSGSIQGTSISLSFDGSPLQFGTIAGGSFSVNFPENDGTLAAVTFRQASANQYNQAVDSLKASVAHEDQLAANAQALAAAETKIDQMASAVTSDIGQLGSDVGGLPQAVQGVQQSLQSEGQELSTTQAAAQKVEAEAQQYPSGNYGQVCDNAGGAADDAGGVADAAGGVEDAGGGVADVIATVGNDEAGLQHAWSSLKSLEGDLPGYTPPNAPSQSDVTGALNAANGAVNSAVGSTNGDISQANTEVATAYQAADAAYQAGGCGAPPAVPQAQPPIGQ